MYNKRLRYLRECHKIKNDDGTERLFKQSDVSEMLGFKKDTYGEYEREKSTIPIKHLNTLCNFYNVSLDYIFEFTDQKNYKNNRENIDKKLQSIRLKELRKDKKITQATLADNINVAKSTISEYERSINIISTSFLYAICQKYNISADYLIGKNDNPKRY